MSSRTFAISFDQNQKDFFDLTLKELKRTEGKGRISVISAILDHFRENHGCCSVGNLPIAALHALLASEKGVTVQVIKI